MTEKIRIQKFLSNNNTLSRRTAEKYLLKGLIKVNGKVVTELGTTIDPEKDIVTIDTPQEEHLYYIAFHKPTNIVSNLPQGDEKEIRDLLPAHLRNLSTIGRLDKDSEGLILLTNDGVFAKLALTSDHEREYLVWINDELTPAMKERLEKGIMLFGKKTLPVTITMIKPNFFSIKMREGKNRQIRRMVRSCGRHVQRLKRVRYGIIELGDLEKKAFRNLTEKEIASIRN